MKVLVFFAITLGFATANANEMCQPTNQFTGDCSRSNWIWAKEHCNGVSGLVSNEKSCAKDAAMNECYLSGSNNCEFLGYRYSYVQNTCRVRAFVSGVGGTSLYSDGCYRDNWIWSPEKCNASQENLIKEPRECAEDKAMNECRIAGNQNCQVLGIRAAFDHNVRKCYVEATARPIN